MNRLKELRISAGKNMKETAQALGLAYTTYVSYEKGDREPNSEMLILFATHYGVSIDYLIGKAEDPAPSPAERRPVSDEDIKFALFGGGAEITDAMFEEVKRFAAFVKQREQEKEAKKD